MAFPGLEVRRQNTGNDPGCSQDSREQWLWESLSAVTLWRGSLTRPWACGFLQAAKLCQRQATELFQCRFFRDKDADRDERCIADGIIYGFRDTAVQLYIPRYVPSAAVGSKKACLSCREHAQHIRRN